MQILMDEHLFPLTVRKLIKVFCRRINQFALTPMTDSRPVRMQSLCPSVRFFSQRLEWWPDGFPEARKQIDQYSKRIDIRVGTQAGAWQAALKQQCMPLCIMCQQPYSASPIPDLQSTGFVHAFVMGPLHFENHAFGTTKCWCNIRDIRPIIGRLELKTPHFDQFGDELRQIGKPRLAVFALCKPFQSFRNEH